MNENKYILNSNFKLANNLTACKLCSNEKEEDCDTCCFNPKQNSFSFNLYLIIDHDRSPDEVTIKLKLITKTFNKGISFGGPSSITCSICEQEIFLCEHITGKKYDGKECFGISDFDLELQELSLIPASFSKKITRITLEEE